MDFRSMLQQLDTLNEETKETSTGRVHKGKYGTSHQPDEKRDEYGHKVRGSKEGPDIDPDDDKKEAPVKRGRGRPSKSGEHSKNPEEKKKQKDREEAGKKLQSMVVGNLPKGHDKKKGTVVKGKAQSADQKEGGDKKKASLKEWIKQVEDKFVIENAPGQQLTVKPMPGAAQLVDPATQKVMATGDAAAVKNIQGAVAQGKVQMRAEEMTEEQLDELSSALSGRAYDAAQAKRDAALQSDEIPSDMKIQLARAASTQMDRFRDYTKTARDREKQAAAQKAAADIGFSPAQLRKMQMAKAATNEGEIPHESGVDNIGAGLGAGRSQKTLETKQLDELSPQTLKSYAGKARGQGSWAAGVSDALSHGGEYPNRESDKYAQFAKKRFTGANRADAKAGADKPTQSQNYDWSKKGGYGTGNTPVKGATLESAKPDYPDIDNDGNEKEPISKAAKDAKKKKKVNESMHKHSAARLMGKAHALAKEGYNCKYEDIEEAKCYHEGYKEGLDECYGQEPIVGLIKENPMPATVPGMASQAQKSAAAGYSADMHEKIKNATPQELMTMAYEFGGDAMHAKYELEMLKKAQAELKGLAEDEFGEGNLFTGNLAKARAAGKSHADLDGDGDMEKVTEFGMAFEAWDKELNALLTESEEVNEGMTVSISKGQQGAPDSVSVSAQDGEADALLGLIKSAGLGLFGDEGGHIGAGADNTMLQKQGGIDVVGDHDGMMALIKKVAGTGEESSDYEDEEGHEEHGHEGHDHEHTDEEQCNECGYMESKCQCDKEMVDEVESEDQMAYEVAEDNPPDSGAAETTADENAEAAEDEALAKADELKEWANQAGKGPGKGTDAGFEQDIEFMTKFIAGGLNKPKSTGQTTIPVVAGQNSRMEDPMAWARLAGIKK